MLEGSQARWRNNNNEKYFLDIFTLIAYNEEKNTFWFSSRSDRDGSIFSLVLNLNPAVTVKVTFLSHMRDLKLNYNFIIKDEFPVLYGPWELNLKTGY